MPNLSFVAALTLFAYLCAATEHNVPQAQIPIPFHCPTPGLLPGTPFSTLSFVRETPPREHDSIPFGYFYCDYKLGDGADHVWCSYLVANGRRAAEWLVTVHADPNQNRYVRSDHAQYCPEIAPRTQR